MSKSYYTNKLYPFQDLVLKLIMEIDDRFYLTGGTALGRHYLKHRYSDDLDLFVNSETDFKQLSNIIISQLQNNFSEIDIVVHLCNEDARFNGLAPSCFAHFRSRFLDSILEAFCRTSRRPLLLLTLCQEERKGNILSA